MTRLKICGLRDVGSALVAAGAGADFLGFVFVPCARRQLTVEEAKAVIDGYRRCRGSEGPRLVGLFADQPIEVVNHTVECCGLDFAQLCGNEPPEYWQEVGARVIKQVKVREHGAVEGAVAETLARVKEIVCRGHIALLDKYEAGSPGGTGRSFDWTIAREVAKRHDIVLAGGLSPENVGRAIRMVGPWAVDVSSGVESEGVKDPRKIRAFAGQVARADGRAGEHGEA